jgi:hypothetical protein
MRVLSAGVQRHASPAFYAVCEPLRIDYIISLAINNGAETS